MDNMTNTNNKKEFGQFFTTNHKYILQGLEPYIKDKDVTDPFAGGGDLLNWAKTNNAKTIVGYDIDPIYINNQSILKNDSIQNPLKYDFVLTNPPYLNQNKQDDNSILKNSKHTDLYQISLEKIMDSMEGIVIVPINFLSSESAKYIRSMFFDKFTILHINYFTTQVFKDTTYNVIAFYYRLKDKFAEKIEIPFYIYSSNKQANQKMTITLQKQYSYQIGGEFVNEIGKFKNRLKLARLEEEDLEYGNNKLDIAHTHVKTKKEIFVSDETSNLIKRNIVMLKAIDTGTKEGVIALEDIRKANIEALVSIKTSRNQIQILFPPEITITEQETIIERFNSILQTKRAEYFSLFMTNFRDNNRKRISFNFAYDLINYIYFNEIKGVNNDKKQSSLF